MKTPYRVALVLLLAGCGSVSAAPPVPAPAPVAVREIRTTSGAIFERNLASRIAGLESRLRTSPRRDDQLALAAALHTRGAYRGDLDDLARSIELATQAIEVYPEDGNALVMRARTELTVHRFADARRDLDEATHHGAPRALTLPLQAELEWNGGDYERAIPHIRNLAELSPNTHTLTRLAVLEHTLGNFDEAVAGFEEAERHIADTDPLAVSWFYVQWGKMLMDRGDHAAAEPHLREAVRHLPSYILAREHLAECIAEQGRTDEAIDLYEAVVADSRDPEFQGALAALYREAGRIEEANALAARASGRFHELLERYPEAMMWHAAAFFRDEGNDRALSLELLTSNVELRPNSESLVALADAQIEAGRAGDAAETIARALAMPPRSAALFETASRAYEANDRDDLARTMNIQAGKLGRLSKAL